MRAPFRSAVVSASVLTACLLSGQAWAASCATVVKNFPAAAAGVKVEFVRPVVVSRSGQGDGTDILDLVTDHKIDGQLRCKGDQFVQFNAKIQASADEKLRDAFFRIEQAALVSVVQWPTRKAARTLHAMTADAADYLRASIERGDVDLSGKVEEHAGGAADIGLIWTQAEREFIVVAGE